MLVKDFKVCYERRIAPRMEPHRRSDLDTDLVGAKSEIWISVDR